MNVCCVSSSRASSSPALDGWRRALGADTRSFEDLCALLVALSPAESFPYDLVLFAISPASLSWAAPLRRLLERCPGVVLAALLEGPLPARRPELARYRAALVAADLVVASQYSLCRELSAKLGLLATDIEPPWLCARPSAYEQPAERFRSGATSTGRPALAVVSTEGCSHGWLLQRLGVAAYAWALLRYRIRFHTAQDDPAEIANSELVYLPQAINDGGALAAYCAELGALLVAPREYDPARFCFPFTLFGAEPGRERKLLLWLLGAPDMLQFFREHAAHRARQLSDGDRRLQLGRALQQRFPGFSCPSDAQRPSLLEQIRHVSGPTELSYGKDECVVVCLVRNGGEHTPSFLTHYRGLGVRHFFFVDNGSDDGSRALLQAQPDATVYTSSLPHKHYENELRRLIIERHCQNRWCLNVDIDELFDYPGSEQLPLGGLLGYLTTQGAIAMVAYLLDMFAPETVFGQAQALDLKSAYPCYDLSDVHKTGYFADEVVNFCDANELKEAAIGCYFGGIRSRLFGSGARSKFLLTKHPLIFLDGVLRPVVHPHYSNRARVADVTGALYHYKLTPGFKAKVEESVVSERYVKLAQHQYDEYQRQLAKRASLVIDTPGRRQLHDAWQLVDEGFLHASSAFRDWLQRAQGAAPAVSSRAPAPSVLERHV